MKRNPEYAFKHPILICSKYVFNHRSFLINAHLTSNFGIKFRIAGFGIMYVVPFTIKIGNLYEAFYCRTLNYVKTVYVDPRMYD